MLHVAPQDVERFLVFAEGYEVVGKIDNLDTLAILLLSIADNDRHIEVGNKVREWVAYGELLLIEEMLANDSQCALVFHLFFNEPYAYDVIYVVVELAAVALKVVVQRAIIQ